MKYYIGQIEVSDELYHHGIKGMEWGKRRFQYKNGKYTPLGKLRYSLGDTINGLIDQNITGSSARKNANNADKAALEAYENDNKTMGKRLANVADRQREVANNSLFGRIGEAHRNINDWGADHAAMISKAFGLDDNRKIEPKDTAIGLSQLSNKGPQITMDFSQNPKLASLSREGGDLIKTIGNVVSDKNVRFLVKELSRPGLEPGHAQDLKDMLKLRIDDAVYRQSPAYEADTAAKKESQKKIASLIISGMGFSNSDFLADTIINGVDSAAKQHEEQRKAQNLEKAKKQEYNSSIHKPKPYRDLYDQITAGNYKFINNESASIKNKKCVSSDVLMDKGYNVEDSKDYAILPQTRMIGNDSSTGIVLSPILTNGDVVDSKTLDSMIDSIKIDSDGRMSIPDGTFKYKLSDILVSSYDLSGMTEKEKNKYMHDVQHILKIVDWNEYGLIEDSKKRDRARAEARKKEKSEKTLSKELDEYKKSDIYKAFQIYRLFKG